MRQVDLLVRTLPFIARHEAFALKGGTAINLFFRNMPRLSVDIDLTYLPIEDRETTLRNIDTILEHIREDLLRNLRGVNVQRVAGGGNNDTRVLVRQGNAEIKIETSPVARGTVHAPQLRRVSESVEETFGFAEMPVVSFEDLFGGKLHAAVDRQHPRDLFDVKLLYENEGLTDALFRTFLIYVASAGRPPHELVKPSLADLDEAFVKEFEGMTTEPVRLEDLKSTRARQDRRRLSHGPHPLSCCARADGLRLYPRVIDSAGRRPRSVRAGTCLAAVWTCQGEEFYITRSIDLSTVFRGLPLFPFGGDELGSVVGSNVGARSSPSSRSRMAIRIGKLATAAKCARMRFVKHLTVGQR
ncbi:hypothetical protein KGO5_02348 [Sinorhizobium sp. KGO-5]|nr:hypothetical protein KGO5_02348 [Sinorhizobium sp. KGO-5]